MNSIKDDVGLQTIQDIYRSMQIDEEWTRGQGRGVKSSFDVYEGSASERLASGQADNVA